MRKTIMALTAALLAVGTTLLGVGTANADPGGPVAIQPLSLCTNASWEVGVSNVKSIYMPSTVRATGSVGAVITITIGTTVSVSSSTSASVTVGLSSVLASVSATAGVTLTSSNTFSTTYALTGTIPSAGAYIEWGTVGRSFSYTAKQYDANCNVLKTESGTGKGTTKTPYGYLSWVGFTG